MLLPRQCPCAASQVGGPGAAERRVSGRQRRRRRVHHFAAPPRKCTPRLCYDDPATPSFPSQVSLNASARFPFCSLLPAAPFSSPILVCRTADALCVSPLMLNTPPRHWLGSPFNHTGASRQPAPDALHYSTPTDPAGQPPSVTLGGYTKAHQGSQRMRTSPGRAAWGQSRGSGGWASNQGSLRKDASPPPRQAAANSMPLAHVNWTLRRGSSRAHADWGEPAHMVDTMSESPASVMVSTDTRCSLPQEVPRSTLLPGGRVGWGGDGRQGRYTRTPPHGLLLFPLQKNTRQRSGASAAHPVLSNNDKKTEVQAPHPSSGARRSWKAWRSTQSPTCARRGSCWR